jgi:hypothetical protein
MIQYIQEVRTMTIKKELKARYYKEYAELQKAVEDFNQKPSYEKLEIAEDARSIFCETCMEILVELMQGDKKIIERID